MNVLSMSGMTDLYGEEKQTCRKISIFCQLRSRFTTEREKKPASGVNHFFGLKIVLSNVRKNDGESTV